MTFKNRVYELVKKIPAGMVATYGQIARLAGNPKAARAVGILMKNNPYLDVPCHRVVGAKGELVGYSKVGGIKSKKQILENEGVFFKEGRVDLEKSRWQFSPAESVCQKKDSQKSLTWQIYAKIKK